MTTLVTGGAGFIGSHLVRALVDRGEHVRVLDNLSSGSISNLSDVLPEHRFEFIKGDVLKSKDVTEALSGVEIIYHLAANPEVQAKKAGSDKIFNQNILGTYNLLEGIAKTGDVEALIFTSSSTVYGEPTQLPTKESYAPLKPISYYGGSKLAGEALISAYARMNGFRAIIYRLANIVGAESNHGVIYDFYCKLRDDPHELEVLGDGTQTKSYLHISDCVDAIMLGSEISGEGVEIYNLGSEDRVSVMGIASIVKEELGLPGAKIRLTGGIDGGRGWRGDVKTMHLDTSKVKRLGWNPRFNSEEAVRETVKGLANSDARKKLD